MSPELRKELHQRRPFRSLEQEAYLNVVRTAAHLADGFEQMLRSSGLTAAQYNVLRILRGAEPEGLCRYELRDRMLTRMPDVTRLLDRMEKAGLVTRVRNAADRRMVTTRITARARRLLDELDEPVRAEHERQLGHLDRTRLRQAIEILTAMRAPK